MNNSPDTVTPREVEVYWDHVASVVLKQQLQLQLRAQTVALELRRAAAHGAISDPTVLVAVVSGASAAMTAVIMGLFRLLEGRHQKIVLQAKDGSRLEIPWNTPKERIEELIALVHQMQLDRIRVVDEKYTANTSDKALAEQLAPGDADKPRA